MNIDEVVMHGGSGVGGAGGGIGTGPIGGVGMCNESKSLTFTNDFDMISPNNSLNQVPRSSQIWCLFTSEQAVNSLFACVARE